jgi:methyltransferase (TIGR00027 family)
MPNVSTNVTALETLRYCSSAGHGTSRAWNADQAVRETALAMAVARWREADVPEPLFADPYAPLFITAADDDGWRPAFLTNSPRDLRRGDPILFRRIRTLHDYAASRTRFFDAFFEQSNTAGVRQVVIMGAGLDVGAWRLRWPSDSTVFDVDSPKIMDFKISQLWAANAVPGCEYRAVAVDLRADWPRRCAMQASTTRCRQHGRRRDCPPISPALIRIGCSR